MNGVYGPKKIEIKVWIVCLIILVFLIGVASDLTIEMSSGGLKAFFYVLLIVPIFFGIVYLVVSRDVLRTIEFKDDCLVITGFFGGERRTYWNLVEKASLSKKVLFIGTHGGRIEVVNLDIFFTTEEKAGLRKYLKAKMPHLKIGGQGD